MNEVNQQICIIKSLQGQKRFAQQLYQVYIINFVSISVVDLLEETCELFFHVLDLFDYLWCLRLFQNNLRSIRTCEVLGQAVPCLGLLAGCCHDLIARDVARGVQIGRTHVVNGLVDSRVRSGGQSVLDVRGRQIVALAVFLCFLVYLTQCAVRSVLWLWCRLQWLLLQQYF